MESAPKPNGNTAIFKVTFVGDAHFSSVRFRKNANFAGVLFGKDALFRHQHVQLRKSERACPRQQRSGQSDFAVGRVDSRICLLVALLLSSYSNSDFKHSVLRRGASSW